MGPLAAFKLRLKWLLYPGINLHARLRHRSLPQYFGGSDDQGPRRVLDAGSGNGMLSYQSYRKGNTVIGVSFKSSEVVGSRKLFNDFLGIPEERLRFEEGNLYDLEFPNDHFDEIICAEVLEHLRRDTEVCRSFWRILKPGGVLHICAPNAEHPYNATFPLDESESGGHVRAGYTWGSYRTLLEPIGFQLVEAVGLGGPVRQFFNWRIKEVQSRFGVIAGFPLFLSALPLLVFESRRHESERPFSLYVKAAKPAATLENPGRLSRSFRAGSVPAQG